MTSIDYEGQDKGILDESTEERRAALVQDAQAIYDKYIGANEPETSQEEAVTGDLPEGQE